MTVVIDGTTGITAPDSSISNDLVFTGTGNRITGDFSNATVANAVLFQTSATNGQTRLRLIPNGTQTDSALDIYTNSSDQANSGLFSMRAGAADMALLSNRTGTGTYLPMTFNTGGSERVRVDTSGNVGVGMTPTNFGNGYTVLQVANASNGGMLYLTNTANAGGRIYGNGAGLTYDAFSTTYHAFNTNGTERARITSSGDFLLNATSFSAAADNFRWSVTGIQLGRSAAGDQIAFFTASSFSGKITSTTTSVTYATSSDYRLKEQVQPMTGALAKVALLKPVTYKWKVDGSDGQGFIAHELAEVEAGCVTGAKDAVDEEGNPQYQGIDTSFLVATLAAAIQELKTIVDTQATTITALTTRITALEQA